MAETIEEVSYNYEDEGKLVRKEIKKEILTKGAWATVMFLYQELDRKTESWGPPKVSIVRFKKSGGVYRKQSSFNISSEKQARQIVDIITNWYTDMKGGEASTLDVVSGVKSLLPRLRQILPPDVDIKVLWSSDSAKESGA